MLGGEPVGALWPGVPTGPVVGLAVLAGMLLIGLGVGAWTGVQGRRRPRDGFAGARAFKGLTEGRVARRTARRLRPSLAGARHLQPNDLGMPIGHLDGPGGGPVRTTWEDVALAICAPRTGKTTSIAVPAVLDAPGAVVATSNKADLWQHTARVRADDTGERVWTFDPQSITRRPQTFTWNPLAGLASVEHGRRLAGHFVQEIRRSHDSGDFWDRDAEDLLAGLLLAAALDGAALRQVAVWLTSTASVAPYNILTEHGFVELAESMAGRAGGAAETREGVYATARAAAACLTDPVIMRWVCPQPGLETFDPEAFATSRQTLYLLSKDGAGSAAPLVAAFADRVMLEAVRAAEGTPSGRLDPPLVAVLDEAANICRITELPRLYSHLGSRGVVPLTILQSRTQGRRVWGESGMDELFGAATVKVIGAGIDDQPFAEDISRLIGDHDVPVKTRGVGGTSWSTRRDRVLPADKVRALKRGSAVLLVTGVRPGMLRLVPWMLGPRAVDIRAAAASEAAEAAAIATDRRTAVAGSGSTEAGR
ncbi:type IV secretory system conjugative DNA transfer family protein [Kineosporia sp. A_224]|uniref:type IV secretory system conjugative DNA transfer family protein n=1 Tax=Kineosporia sp. A_224 TaxID=1962180 RepID=UPI0013042E40|nr:TraM recognition domain-containing protein [Kineosporia sp. A_224]